MGTVLMVILTAVMIVLACGGLGIMFSSSFDKRNDEEKMENKLVSPMPFVLKWLGGFAMIIGAAYIKFILY
jgi:flagellar basal body-associated protein FliL